MPYTKYFEIVGDVINANIDIIARQRGITRNAAYSAVTQHVINNSVEWRSGRQPVIPYQDPLCRIAYLYGTVAVNANLVEHVFSHDPELEQYIDTVQANQGQVGICAFGGGPGTELLGIAKWIESRCLRDQIVLDFLLLDRVNEWLDSWQAIRREIESRFRNNISTNRNEWPLTISGSFSAIDIMNTANFGNLGTVFVQDIYILCDVISEVFENFQNLQSFTANMAVHAPAGSKFLFIDRNEQRWKNEVNRLAGVAGISLSPLHTTNRNMSLDEQSTDLGQIYTDLHATWAPRVTWNSFWVVGTKN